MAIAGDDPAAKKTVPGFLDAIGYDAYDAGPLREGWRYQRETIAYPHSTDGSFEHPGRRTPSDWPRCWRRPSATARCESLRFAQTHLGRPAGNPVQAMSLQSAPLSYKEKAQ